MDTNKKTARLAGFLWLLMFIFGPIAQVVRSKLFVTGDMEATAHNIMANELLFRIGFVSDLLMMVTFLLLPIVLYKLLSTVDKSLSTLMVIFVIVSVPLNMLNLLNGYEIANIFFALWLVPLGILVYKSGFLPKVLGILLVVGGCGLFAEVITYFLFPGYEIVNTILIIPQTIAEFAFLLWILIRGINESRVKTVNLCELQGA